MTIPNITPFVKMKITHYSRFIKRLVLCTIIFLVSISVFLPILPIQAKAADVIVQYSGETDINSKQLLQVYFAYGNPTDETDAKDVSFAVSIAGNGIEIVQSQVNDLYYKPENIDATPRILNCSSKFEGTPNLVGSELTSKTGIKAYGPQTALNGANPGGAVSGLLKAKHTGCIQVGLRINSSAKAGEVAQITFNPDAGNVPSYTDRTRPGLQIVKFLFSSAANTCSNNQEFVKNQCVNKCSDNETRDITNGQCVKTVLACAETQEIFAGQCVNKCVEPQARDDSGICRLPVSSANPSQDCQIAGCGKVDTSIFNSVETRIATLAVFITALCGLLLAIFVVLRKWRSIKGLFNKNKHPIDRY